MIFQRGRYTINQVICIDELEWPQRREVTEMMELGFFIGIIPIAGRKEISYLQDRFFNDSTRWGQDGDI